MFGWILTQLGNPDNSIEFNTKVLQRDSKFGSFEIDSETDTEKISNYPISA
jgi:hypothetical protein